MRYERGRRGDGTRSCGGCRFDRRDDLAEAKRNLHRYYVSLQESTANPRAGGRRFRSLLVEGDGEKCRLENLHHNGCGCAACAGLEACTTKRADTEARRSAPTKPPEFREYPEGIEPATTERHTRRIPFDDGKVRSSARRVESRLCAVAS